MLASDLTVSAAEVYISLPYIMAARAAGIDRNEEFNYVAVNLWSQGLDTDKHLFWSSEHNRSQRATDE